MQALDPLDDDAAATVFRDVILLALLGFVALVILLLPHVNPPQTKVSDLLTPGNVIVEIKWPEHIDADVDLWVQAPGDGPVGWSQRGGSIFDLLRDDLGYMNDLTAANHEMAYSRGVPAGEYIVNIHMYRNEVQQWPVPVWLIVSVKLDVEKPARQIILRKVALVRIDQEETVVRFELNESGELLPLTVNNLYKTLLESERL
ncbi:MAG: hypothetical protein CMM46_12525 [Rhodospirillaceae bacterium]|nr:hypothetical protein [Rhodospirillaceae bacterium]